MVARGRQDGGHKVGFCLPPPSVQLQTRHQQHVRIITLPLFSRVKYFTVEANPYTKRYRVIECDGSGRERTQEQETNFIVERGFIHTANGHQDYLPT
ncbi:hypothetical protein Pmani_022236 [Petrolisthes manimaculis]|uniref:Uncharacterized protein n=1 Tax=Petrolisthes manimaculis TaxID=1843537 RepID=A0AAE1U0U9_9EUCA|nr:hypothetical protein Pmani_022236 [Petrolisthes manimaculis]